MNRGGAFGGDDGKDPYRDEGATKDANGEDGQAFAYEMEGVGR